MSHIRLITFDSTGTLLKLREAPHQYYARVARAHGIKVYPEQLVNTWKTAYNYASQNNPNFGINKGGWNKWWQGVIYDTFQKAKGLDPIDQNKLESISKQLIDDYKRSDCWFVSDSAIDLLELLKKQYKIKLGVISNFDSTLPDILEAMNIKNYFNFIITSYDVGYEKPDPTIFKKALIEAGEGIIASEALHIGDNANKDAAGARDAGWQYALVNVSDISHYPELNSSYLFRDLKHVHSSLREDIICSQLKYR